MWVHQGKIETLDPYHRLFSIWAITQHYADFEAQILMIRGENVQVSHKGSDAFVAAIFDKFLTPDS